MNQMLRRLLFVLVMSGSAFPVFALAPVTVATSLVKTGPIRESIAFSGQVKPFEEAWITTDVTGRVAKILVENGQPVKAGAPVVLLDADRLRIAVRMSEAGLGRAEAELKEKKKDFERRSILMEKKVLNEKAFDEAEAEAAKAGITVQSQKAALDLDRLNLERATIRAPIGGFFASRDVFLNQSVSPGMRLGKVIDIGRVYIDVKVPENQINRITIGQKASVNGSHTGSVAFIDPYGDESRSFLVRILVDNADLKLKPNMFVTGQIVLKELADVPLIPIDALTGPADAPVIYIIRNNKAVRLPVTPIAREKDWCAAREVEPGETIVTVGAENLADGTPVTVAASPEAPSAGVATAAATPAAAR
ncbi:MAG TPA: efflux RND transporter periplasmic adaptor subunit [Candidatus Ozemobacteraceae bacterium]|nr:efflux RND transporter periplasmic adaptor subunit [Candidatus Ozemobacteraceae bacterium]